MVHLVHVAIGLSNDGGGAAHLGRLIAQTVHEYSQSRHYSFEVLHLGSPVDVGVNAIKIQHFNYSQKKLALAIWKRQLPGSQTLFIFDHLGVSRPQAYIPKFLRSPYLLFLLGIEAWRDQSWDRFTSMRNATRRLSISRFTMHKTLQKISTLPACDVLHLALEEKPVTNEPIDMELLSQLGDSAILIVGRLDGLQRYKGHDELIEIMPEVLAAHPTAQLVVVGKGDDLARLQQKSHSLHVADRVLFTGFVNNNTLSAIYEKCAIFAMPSRDEGFGLVFLEAMKAKKPCVALCDTAPAEIIVDGVTGYLVMEGKSESLRDALLKLLQNTDLAKSFGEAGFQRWKEAFSVKKFKAGLAHYLDESIKNL